MAIATVFGTLRNRANFFLRSQFWKSIIVKKTGSQCHTIHKHDGMQILTDTNKFISTSPTKIASSQSDMDSAGNACAPTEKKPAHQYTVHHDKKAQKFYIILENGDEAMLQYTLKKNGTVDLIHTEVPSALEGRGFGKHLAKAALDHFSGTCTSMHLTCPFVQGYAAKYSQPHHHQFIIKKKSV